MNQTSIMKKIIVFVCTFCISCSTPVQNVHATDSEQVNIKEPQQLYALSACLMDAESGRILFSKNSAQKRANASTTKILTLIVTLENAKLDELVTVSSYAAKQPDVQLNINTGEQYRLEDLCYSLMLESHNDAAVAIAEHVGGSVEDFAKLMNEKAREIGCKDSTFITPNGLDAKNENGIHGTTAEDLARILRYCIMQSPQKDKYLEITRTPSYSFRNKLHHEDGSVTNGNRNFTCNNHNAFLRMMDGALSGKTGFTGDAGYCYVGSLRNGDRTFIVSLLGCGWPNNKGYKWSDTRKLMQYGLDNYSTTDWRKLRDQLDVPDKVCVSHARTKSFDLKKSVAIDIVDNDAFHFTDKVLLRSDEKVDVIYQLSKNVEAPIAMGEVLGTIEYKVGETTIGSELIVCTKTVDRSDYNWRLHQVLEKILF